MKNMIQNSKLYNWTYLSFFDAKSININTQLKLIFVHIPKTAGTSLKKALDLRYDSADHRLPHFFCSKKTWENYTSFCVVRNPIDRFISSYKFHISDEYYIRKGSLHKVENNLQKLSPRTYFEKFKNTVHLQPQHLYLEHKFSKNNIDLIIRFEKLDEGLQKLSKKLNTKIVLDKVNTYDKRSSTNSVILDEELKFDLVDFYKEDYKQFNY